MCVIDAQRYASWLANTSNSMMDRMSSYVASLDFEANMESLSKSEMSEQQILGLIASRNHYGDIDLEHYRLNVMQALDIAEGKLDAATKPAPQKLLVEQDTNEDQNTDDKPDLEAAIVDIITKLDQGDGVEFETILVNAEARGFHRAIAVDTLEELSDDCTVHEPAFGWFRLV